MVIVFFIYVLEHGVCAFWILGVQFGSCGYIGILLVSK